MTNREEPRPRLLLVNDDGIDAPGIQALRRALAPHYDTLVVAPTSERSGSGCGLSVNREMAVHKRIGDNGEIWGYAVDGTPADCVKFPIMTIEGYEPDLVLSGVNRGSNLGNSVWYSGTVAGAMEATMLGLRAMAVSLSFVGEPDVWHFDAGARLALGLVPWLLAQTWEPRTFWNLNLPNIPFEEIGGVRFSRQGISFYVDNFSVSRVEGETHYYLNVGERLEESPHPPHSDDLVIEAGDASLSLLKMDLSVDLPPAAREALEREWNQLVFDRPGRLDPRPR